MKPLGEAFYETILDTIHSAACRSGHAGMLLE